MDRFYCSLRMVIDSFSSYSRYVGNYQHTLAVFLSLSLAANSMNFSRFFFSYFRSPQGTLTKALFLFVLLLSIVGIVCLMVSF